MRNFRIFIESILNYQLLHIGDYFIFVHNIVSILLILFLTKLSLYLLKKMVYTIGSKRYVSKDNLYTIVKIISYFIWVFSTLLILNALGIKGSAILTSSAALLVGVGLGLQQTFNDFISGIILLFEGKTKIKDIIELDGKILQLLSIGLRTTECIDRDGISIIIPNSKIVTNHLINYSHRKTEIRFHVNIGVAYGSDVELVVQLLEACAKTHPKINQKEIIEARFVDFGSSALQFRIFFSSSDIFTIEKVKSDLRMIISKSFIENNIKVPFPQMDIHLNNKA